MKNKKNNTGIKNIRGNVTIMVLIIGLVIIVAITALTQFMFKDIIFTKLDESKLKALNIAEAGISNIFSKIEKFHNDEIPLPSSPYSDEVVDSDNNIQGSYSVTYEEIYNDEDKLTNYIINSEGTDEGSGQTGTIRVNLGVSFSTEVDIFGYIYSRGSLNFFDLINISFMNGPLYVGGDLIIRDLISIGDVVSGGKILVGGNIDMEGLSRIRTGPINVAGNIEMSGGLLGSPYIHHNFDDPLIVMGDIRMNGNPYIARDSTGRPINLSLHGQIIPSGARVYYTPPIGDDIFDPPKLNVEVYVNSFISQIQEPPSDVLVIAPGDMTGGVFIIDPDLINKPPPNDVFQRTNGDNSIRFYKIGSDYYLEIHGNVLVNGDIEIDEDTVTVPINRDIYYSGKGKLIATGSINALSGLVPNPISDFPVSSLLILMASGDLNISADNYNNNVGDYNNPDVRILGIAGGTALLSSHNAVLGSLISNQIDAKDAGGILGMLLGSLAVVGYKSNLGDNVPDDLPKLVYGGVTFSKQWEEVID